MEVININNVSKNIHPEKRTDITTVMFLDWIRNRTGLFKDASFPAGPIALLGKQVPEIYNGEWSEISWERPDKIFEGGDYNLFGNMDSSNIVNGYLPNYYFTSAVGALILHNPTAIKDICVFKRDNSYGMYGFYLNVDGEWREIQVDDLLPVFKD